RARKGGHAGRLVRDRAAARPERSQAKRQAAFAGRPAKPAAGTARSTTARSARSNPTAATGRAEAIRQAADQPTAAATIWQSTGPGWQSASDRQSARKPGPAQAIRQAGTNQPATTAAVRHPPAAPRRPAATAARKPAAAARTAAVRKSAGRQRPAQAIRQAGTNQPATTAAAVRQSTAAR